MAQPFAIPGDSDMPLTEHTSKRFDAELDALRTRVLQMGGFVEAQTRSAVRGLLAADTELLDRVVANDHRVNGYEVSLDREISEIIARRQPAAGDLRMLMGVSKAVTDLERVGDEAAKIARAAKGFHQAERLSTPRFNDIEYMSEMAVEMLRRALDCLARLDTAGAAEIVRDDATLDAEFRRILRQLVTFMMEDPRTISAAIDVLFIVKALERVGDHAKNISEYVIYIVKGTDVRHVRFEALQQEALS
jgi:phosphate transport system protein